MRARCSSSSSRDLSAQVRRLIMLSPAQSMERVAGGENALSRRVHAAPSAAAGIAEFRQIVEEVRMARHGAAAQTTSRPIGEIAQNSKDIGRDRALPRASVNIGLLPKHVR